MSKTRLPQSTRGVNPNSGISPQIHFFSDRGVFMSAGVHIGNPTGKGGGKRGKVQGWSKASRRRMRNNLMTFQCTKQYELGATFTIPGPPIPPEDAQVLFKNWCRNAQKAGLCAIWRLEIQKRSQLHWHLIIGYDDIPEWSKIEELWIEQIVNLGWVGVWYEEEKHARLVHALEEGADYELAEDYIADHGEVWPGIHCTQLELFEGQAGPRPVLWLRNRYMLPGAKQHCVDVDVCNNTDRRQKWLRYLFDHSSKAKQEQVAVGVGRHWGIMGREHFKETLPAEVCDLTLKEYSRVVRWLQRLCTPYLQIPSPPFTRRKGYRPRRGHWGTSSWFTHPETVKRMMLQAQSLSPERSASSTEPRGSGAQKPCLAAFVQKGEFEVAPYE